jgi:hypothetical protein
VYQEDRVPATGASAVQIALVKCPIEHSTIVRFLAEWQSCIVHWTGKKTVPCPGVERCPRKVHEQPRDWRAYVAVEVWQPEPLAVWMPGVLEVTANLGETLRERHLVGEVWRLFRRPSPGGRKECAGVLIEVGRPAPVDCRLWLETVLFRVWRTLDVEWGVEPILPPPLSVEPRRAAPPPQVAGKAVEPRPLTGPEMREATKRARAVLDGKVQVNP